MGNHTVDPRKFEGAGTKSLKIVGTNPTPSRNKELICSAKYEGITLDFSKGITIGRLNRNTPEIVAKRQAAKKIKDRDEGISH